MSEHATMEWENMVPQHVRERWDGGLRDAANAAKDGISGSFPPVLG